MYYIVAMEKRSLLFHIHSIGYYERQNALVSLAMSAVLTQIYNAADPFRALEANDPAYVDCQAERCDANILPDFGPSITRSERYT